MGKWSKLSNLSAYGRAEEHLVTQTISGALVTILGVAMMTLLAISEVTEFFQTGSMQVWLRVFTLHIIHVFIVHVPPPSIPFAHHKRNLPSVPRATSQFPSKQEMYVDTKVLDSVKLQFNFTFPAAPCTIISIDILDVSGAYLWGQD